MDLLSAICGAMSEEWPEPENKTWHTTKSPSKDEEGWTVVSLFFLLTFDCPQHLRQELELPNPIWIKFGAMPVLISTSANSQENLLPCPLYRSILGWQIPCWRLSFLKLNYLQAVFSRKISQQLWCGGISFHCWAPWYISIHPTYLSLSCFQNI